MDSKQQQLIKFIQGEKFFQIPVYQRNYDWEKKHVERLLEDIGKLIDGRKIHFLGVITYIEEKIESSAVSKLMVIDGQQRITTAMLFLKALQDVSTELGNKRLSQRILNNYLTNQYEEKNNQMKLQLLAYDQKNYESLFDDKNGLDMHSRIVQNYLICKDQILRWIKNRKKTTQEIFDSFSNLNIIHLALKQGEDDPQLIFESINSTGLDLSPADLIRNFLLMDIMPREEQFRLFSEYWLPMSDKNLHRDNEIINEFFTHFLMYKTESTTVKQERLYDIFKDVYQGTNHEEILQELKKFSHYFEAFIWDSNEYSDSVRESLNALSCLKQTTCYPFLLHVFDDFANNVIDEQTFEKVLHLVVSYYVISMVCGLASMGRRKLFIKLYAQCFAVESNKEKYFESIKKFLCKTDIKDQLSSNEEFFKSLQEIKLWKNKPLCKFLLEDIAGITGTNTRLKPIMILPEEFNESWNINLPADDKIFLEDHETYRYTIGNLALAEFSSDNFFQTKAILRNTDARELNDSVIDKSYWGTNEIMERSHDLSQIILDHYGVNRRFDLEITFDKNEKIIPITLENRDEANGKALRGYVFDGVSFEKKDWQLMFKDIINRLAGKYPDVKKPVIDVSNLSEPEIILQLHKIFHDDYHIPFESITIYTAEKIGGRK